MIIRVLPPSVMSRRQKNPNTARLVRLGGAKGGQARAAALTANQRRAIAMKAANARWSKTKRISPAPAWSDGSASGQLQAELVGTTVLGVPQSIHVEGKVSTGSVDAAGNPSFSGVAQVDLGDGGAPLLDVPFVVALAADGNGS